MRELKNPEAFREVREQVIARRSEAADAKDYDRFWYWDRRLTDLEGVFNDLIWLR